MHIHHMENHVYVIHLEALSIASHNEVDTDHVNPQEVLAEDPAQHLLLLLAKQLHLPTAGVQARLTLVNIFFFPCSSL